MKHAFLVLACLPLSVFAFGQSNPFGNEDHIKITAVKDTLRISWKSKSFILSSIQDLDSCLKRNIPELTRPVADLETFSDMTAEDHRSIIIVMDKYRLPVVSERTLSSGKGASVKMAKYDN